MALELTVVDAFTDRRFGGNPAAVAFVDAFPPESEMHAVAAEMNLAETAFCVPHEENTYDLRWFTPTVEVELCGHATLATAFLLGGEAAFHTRGGVLRCRTRADRSVEMEFPADPPASVELGALPFDDVRHVAAGRSFYLVELADAAEVRALAPDLPAIAALGRPVVVTAAGDRPGIDCVSRTFAPTVGIDEDPVTGSAHCLLAPYWAPRVGRQTLVGEQASRRGGIVAMALAGEQVVLSGQAVAVSRVSFF